MIRARVVPLPGYVNAIYNLGIAGSCCEEQ